jgi:hypothetical protein
LVRHGWIINRKFFNLKTCESFEGRGWCQQRLPNVRQFNTGRAAENRCNASSLTSRLSFRATLSLPSGCELTPDPWCIPHEGRNLGAVLQEGLSEHVEATNPPGLWMARLCIFPARSVSRGDAAHGRDGIGANGNPGQEPSHGRND